MKSVIIYYSSHHGNSKKLAEYLAERYGCEAYSVRDAARLELAAYDAVLFVSGVYALAMGKSLIEYIEENRDALKGIRIGLALTSGMQLARFITSAVEIFEKNELEVSETFQCKGYDTFGPLALFGGINRNRPDQEDLEEAAERFKTLFGLE